MEQLSIRCYALWQEFVDKLGGGPTTEDKMLLLKPSIDVALNGYNMSAVVLLCPSSHKSSVGTHFKESPWL